MSSKIFIVIVNYKVADLVADCLGSLEAEIAKLPGSRVIVVDNDSKDDSVEKINDAINTNSWESWASVISSDYNGGYSYGNNFAIRSILEGAESPDYIHLLNPDTQVRPNAVQELVNFLDQNQEVGLAGGVIEGPDGHLFKCANRFPSIASEFDAGLRLGLVSKLLSRWTKVNLNGDDPCKADWVPGVSLMIRREVFETIGLMDEEYFLYFEETDFCLSAYRSGWPCWYVPKSQVLHISGSSTGVTGKRNKRNRRPDYWFESRQRYFVKNHGWLYAVCADLAWIFGFCLWKIRQILQRKANPDPPYFFRDFIRNCALSTAPKLHWMKRQNRAVRNQSS